MSRRWNRSLALGAVASTLVLLAPLGARAAAAGSPDPIASGAAAAAAAAAANATSLPPGITAAVASVSPVSPPAIATDTTVTVVVSITNNTSATLGHVRIEAVRDAPIIRQSTLDATLAHPAPPTDENLTQPLPTENLAATIAPQRTLQVSYQFPASTIRLTGGVCLCQTGIYPLDLTIYAASGSQAIRQVAWTQTYLISMTNSPAPSPVQVSWLWPLIDVPHRLTDGQLFINDDLAASVSPGGRLDRSLQVLEQVGVSSQLTLVIDPELIDELAVMSSGYHVQQGSTTVVGTGGPAAAAWLSRLRALLEKVNPADVTLTPYDDPNVDAVAQAGLAWSNTMPPAMQERVEQALGRTFPSTLAWPPGETVSSAALAQLVQGGASTVVLNDTTLPGGRDTNPPLDAVADVPASGSAGPVHAVITSQALETRVNALLALDGSQLSQLPALLAELAIRTVEAGNHPSYVVLTPDRYVNTNPATAAAVIASTSVSNWSSPISVSAAVTGIPAVDHGPLVAPAATPSGSISATMMEQARATTTFVSTFASALLTTDVPALLGSYPSSIQGCESAAWTQNASSAKQYAALVATQAQQLAAGIQIVRPSSGAYSLASSNAPLLVTVVNNLPVTVKVLVDITSADGIPGFHTDSVGVQTILANSRLTIKVQAHVARSGHFRVQAVLLTPDGAAIGAPLPLSIYSSVLGTIGVVITVIAFGVLALALINRFTRRWLHRRKAARPVHRANHATAGLPG